MSDATVRLSEAHQFRRAKRLFVKLQRTGRALYDQKRRGRVVAVGDGFHFGCHWFVRRKHRGCVTVFQILFEIKIKRRIKGKSRMESEVSSTLAVSGRVIMVAVMEQMSLTQSPFSVLTFIVAPALLTNAS